MKVHVARFLIDDPDGRTLRDGSPVRICTRVVVPFMEAP